jgi:iron-sulfur cluster repair protein YtfE (RIC family)
VVDTAPGAARVLVSFGLDHCCGGRRRLDDACADAGVDPDQVVEALDGIDAAPPPASCWRGCTS